MQEVTNSHIREYLMQKAARKKIPLSGVFELTPRCNMNCRMCYIRMSEEEMRARGREFMAEEWIAMGKQCAEQGMLMLLLTGGEPFLRPDFRYIYTELKKLGLVISINTNGTLINEETVAWLKENPPAKINITLYGASNETYERLCLNPKGFDQATRAISLLQEAGILVNVNASFTKENIDDMEGIVDFVKAHNLQIRPATYMFPPVRGAREGKVDETVRFTAQESGEARVRMEQCWFSAEKFQHRVEEVLAGKNEMSLEGDQECDRVPSEKIRCMAGKASFWITWDGRMSPCGMLNDPVTYPFRDGFSESWKELYQRTDEIYMPSECTNCSKKDVCTVCAAVVISESGGCSTKKPEYMCQVTDAFLEKMKSFA